MPAYADAAPLSRILSFDKRGAPYVDKQFYTRYTFQNIAVTLQQRGAKRHHMARRKAR